MQFLKVTEKLTEPLKWAWEYMLEPYQLIVAVIGDQRDLLHSLKVKEMWLLILFF